MLSDLPFEVLANITSYLPNASCVSHLSLTSRRLHEYVEKEGWRTFVQSRFPSISAPPYWRDAAHGLTSLSRNWDRRAFIARELRPPNWNEERARRPRRAVRQTMGYQPVIDSYEEPSGNEWAARKEVLAWGAGAELVVRVKLTGEASHRMWEDTVDEDQRRNRFNQHHHRLDWMVYKEKQYADGRDDITTLDIIRPHQREYNAGSAQCEEMVVGRASGELSLLSISHDKAQNSWKTRYETNGRPVRSTDVSPSSQPLLANCLSDAAISLYPLHSSSSTVDPISEINAISADGKGRTWSSRFLSGDRLAVGLGPSVEPIHVYQCAAEGLRSQPIRTFATAGDGIGSDCMPNGSLSVYPIAPLQASSLGGGDTGDLFLSGGYDGIVRLHDMRSPLDCVSSYHDPIDTEAIYSLQPLARERIIAGAARHALIKVFDLRMSGGRAYFTADVSPKPPSSDPASSARHQQQQQQQQQQRSATTTKTAPPPSQSRNPNPMSRPDFNIFLAPPQTRALDPYRKEPHNAFRLYNPTTSPVYSLSSPSACSPTLYAGIENTLVELTLASIMDANPDPIFKYGPSPSPEPLTSPDIRPRETVQRANLRRREKWDPYRDVRQLAMYEQVHGEGDYPSVVWKQVGVGDVGPDRGPGVEGLDERWAA